MFNGCGFNVLMENEDIFHFLSNMCFKYFFFGLTNSIFSKDLVDNIITVEACFLKTFLNLLLLYFAFSLRWLKLFNF